MSDTTRPTPPENLDGEALLEWNRVCDELAELGALQKADRAALVLYVTTWAIHHEMMRHVEKHGAVVKWPNGVVGGSPYYKTSRECVAQLRGLLTDLGLTPLSRSKVKQPDKAPATEPEY